MNKGDLIDHIANAAGITKAQAGDALNAVVNGVESTLKGGGKVSLIGFGTFSVNERNARQGRNPQTGKVINIPAKKVVKFKAGKALTDALN